MLREPSNTTKDFYRNLETSPALPNLALHLHLSNQSRPTHENAISVFIPPVESYHIVGSKVPLEDHGAKLLKERSSHSKSNFYKKNEVKKPSPNQDKEVSMVSRMAHRSMDLPHSGDNNGDDEHYDYYFLLPKRGRALTAPLISTEAKVFLSLVANRTRRKQILRTVFDSSLRTIDNVFNQKLSDVVDSIHAQIRDFQRDKQTSSKTVDFVISESLFQRYVALYTRPSNTLVGGNKISFQPLKRRKRRQTMVHVTAPRPLEAIVHDPNNIHHSIEFQDYALNFTPQPLVELMPQLFPSVNDESSDDDDDHTDKYPYSNNHGRTDTLTDSSYSDESIDIAREIGLHKRKGSLANDYYDRGSLKPSSRQSHQQQGHSRTNKGDVNSDSDDEMASVDPNFVRHLQDEQYMLDGPDPTSRYGLPYDIAHEYRDLKYQEDELAAYKAEREAQRSKRSDERWILRYQIYSTEHRLDHLGPDLEHRLRYNSKHSRSAKKGILLHPHGVSVNSWMGGAARGATGGGSDDWRPLRLVQYEPLYFDTSDSDLSDNDDTYSSSDESSINSDDEPNPDGSLKYSYAHVKPNVHGVYEIDGTYLHRLKRQRRHGLPRYLPGYGKTINYSKSIAHIKDTMFWYLESVIVDNNDKLQEVFHHRIKKLRTIFNLFIARRLAQFKLARKKAIEMLKTRIRYRDYNNFTYTAHSGLSESLLRWQMHQLDGLIKGRVDPIDAQLNPALNQLLAEAKANHNVDGVGLKHIIPISMLKINPLFHEFQPYYTGSSGLQGHNWDSKINPTSNQHSNQHSNRQDDDWEGDGDLWDANDLLAQYTSNNTLTNQNYQNYEQNGQHLGQHLGQFGNNNNNNNNHNNNNSAYTNLIRSSSQPHVETSISAPSGPSGNFQHSPNHQNNPNSSPYNPPHQVDDIFAQPYQDPKSLDHNGQNQNPLSNLGGMGLPSQEQVRLGNVFARKDNFLLQFKTQLINKIDKIILDYEHDQYRDYYDNNVLVLNQIFHTAQTNPDLKSTRPKALDQYRETFNQSTNINYDDEKSDGGMGLSDRARVAQNRAKLQHFLDQSRNQNGHQSGQNNDDGGHSNPLQSIQDMESLYHNGFDFDALPFPAHNGDDNDDDFGRDFNPNGQSSGRDNDDFSQIEFGGEFGEGGGRGWGGCGLVEQSFIQSLVINGFINILTLFIIKCLIDQIQGIAHDVENTDVINRVGVNFEEKNGINDIENEPEMARILFDQIDNFGYVFWNNHWYDW
jgi:hypothetical protein